MADPKRREGAEPLDDSSALVSGGNVEQGGDRSSDSLHTEETAMGYDGQTGQSTTGNQREAADWERLVAQHQEALRIETTLGDEHTRLERVAEALPEASAPDEIEAAEIAVAAAERAYSKAGNQSDALMLQIMATPAPHADALRYKTDLLRGEEYEYLGYAVDGLFGVYAADVLFFAGVGERASRAVLNAFVAELPEFFAEREARADAQYEKAVAAAQVNTAKAMKKLEALARRAEFEAQLGAWLDAVDAGGGRLLDDEPAKGVYLVWATTKLARPSWDLPEAKLDEIREHRARAMSLADSALNASPLPEFVARMREWKAFNSLNSQLEIERHEMTMRVLRDARSYGIDEVILQPHAAN